MNAMSRSGWIAAIALSLFSISAAAQNNEARPGFVPDLSAPSGEGPVGAEDFADITLLPALGWIFSNQSSPVGPTNWFQGNPDVFSAHAGDPNAYIGANFDNVDLFGQICNYLIMPDNGFVDSVTFFTRASGQTFPDRLRVLYSPSGGTTPGDCTTGFGDFTEELLVINPTLLDNTYPEVWTEFTVNPSGDGGGRVAFVYDVSGGGLFGSNSNFIGIDTVSFVAGAPPDVARFLAVKEYDDGNTTEVEVTLSCNTGLPLEQTIGVAPGAPINFVVGDFEQGALDCAMTEVAPEGYTASYEDGDGIGDPAESCAWENMEGGQRTCTISNSLDSVEVEVAKVWIDENPQFNAQNTANAEWSCSNVAFGATSGFLQFFGNPGADSFFVAPDWEDGTTCSITEVGLFESGIEVDDSECQSLLVFPGAGASCTIYNTRLYEGIPTLSQYGLGILALLMLGVGFVAFRRVI